MAGKPDPTNATAPAAKGKSKLSGRTIASAIVLLPAIAVLMPSCILLGINMAPTIVAFVVDRSREKYLTITVGLLNFCGSLPGLIRLWSEGQNYPNALRIASDPFNMLVAYGAAGIGWSIYLALPIILTHYYATATVTRLSALRERQNTLIEAWGEEIAGEAPADPFD